MTSTAIICSTDLVSALLRLSSTFGSMKIGHCMPVGCHRRQVVNELIKARKPIHALLDS